MKTGDQIASDVSKLVAWCVAAVSLLQKHGFAVPDRVASIINDPQFVALAVGALVLLAIQVRKSRVARLLTVAADAAEQAAEARLHR